MVCAIILVAGTSPAMAQANPMAPDPNPVPDVGIDQRLDVQVPLDLEFRDEQGAAVTLGDFFREDTAVILSLVYYECPMLCNETLIGMNEAFRRLEFTVGDEYEVLTVSFDPRETPELAAMKKEIHIEQYGRPGAENGWHFLVGPEESIRTLTETVGFRYEYDEETGLFAHSSAIMILTPDGRTSKYFYGIQFDPDALRLGLVDASRKKIGTLVDQLLLLCFHYDPTTGQYSLFVMRLLRWAGGLTVVVIVAGLVLLSRRGKRAGAKQSEGESAAAGESEQVAHQE
jgi:protein SCO1/2